MLNKIISFSLNNSIIIGIMTMALVIAGIIEFQKLPIDAVPDITNNQVQIITTAPSYAAQDIERKITFPVEQACSNIAGIKEIRSFSRFGLSLITIIFEDDIDIYWARQQVSERIQKVQNDIPIEIGKPELAPITTGLGEIYQYIIRPKKGYEHQYSLTQLREIQDWIVRRQLMGIKGVADVSSFGGKLKQYEISINPYQLNAYRITINDILTALENNNQNTGSAYIEKNSTAYFIRSEGMIQHISDIENIVIKKTENGIPLQIKDIAEVKLSSAPRYGALFYTSQHGDIQYEVAGGIVMMLKGENSNIVVERVKDKIKEIQKNLPEGLIIEPFLDRTKMVYSTIHTVSKNLIEGASIVIIILVLFLGNIRYGILVASIIPLSMCFAVIMMNTFKVSGNLMSMGALDFGLIVDGSVIIVENIIYQLSQSHLYQKLTPSMTKNIVYQSTSRMMNAAVFGQLIILIVYLPVLYFSGIEGKMFKPMAQTVIFALTGSFILSITYIPVMSAWIAQKGKISHLHLSNQLIKQIEKVYFYLFKKFFRKAQGIILFVIILFFISGYILFHAGGEFMPVLEEGDFAVETRLITGSGLSTTIEYCKKASYILAKEYPDEVEKIVSKIGSGEIPTDPMPIENADMMIILHPPHQWKKAHNFDELAQKMQHTVSSITGISTSFQYPVQMRFNELIAGSKQDVVCKIFGENIDSLAKYAHQLARILSNIRGVEGIYKEPIYGQPQILIQIDREKLAQYNIHIKNINAVIKSIVAGNIIGDVYENERKFNIVLRIDSTYRNIESIYNLLITSENGDAVPLNQIANIILQTDVNQIQREDAKRRIIVGFNVRQRDIESVINELKQASKQLNLPPGYYIKYGGSFENLESAKKRLMITVPIALTLIFLMLYLSFSSVSLSLLIYSTIPMSIIGGICLMYIRNMPFSISAGVGFIALFGIAVLNGIVLISEFNQLKKEHTLSLKIILKGIQKRLRPVLMTATVASLGFFPMFINTDVGANVQRPLATVVIGGLISSTVLTLFILPALYYHFILKRKKMQHSISIILLIIFTLQFNHTMQAQYIVKYSMCIDSATKNNLLIQSQKSIAEYQKELIHTGWNINKTSFQIQQGQYNGVYNDNAVSIQQNLLFPSTYHYQKQIFKSEWNIAQLQTELEKRNIKYTTAKLFYDIIIHSEKIKLLKKMDSVYTENLKLIEYQYEKGNISRLEKDALSNTIYQNQLLITESIKEKQKMILILELLTRIKPIQDIDYQNIKATYSLSIDSSSITKHPALLISEQNINKQNLKIKLEQSKLFPDVFFNYTNQSLTGWGTDNVYYPPSKRFQYILVGIELPVFASSFTHKIQAEKKLFNYTNYQYQWQKDYLSSELQKLIIEYRTYQKMIEEYENKILPNAYQISYVASLNFQKGNINFIEWAHYIQQSFDTQINYLNYIQIYNHTIFQIQYLINP